ncbi:hypothetical protein BDZ89DRAFT_1045304 [Hymenopellis radicata]|nr:hypothetical protein BDZ89DRAFT_1045304 [Hymenopellis radicata]
MPWALPSLAHYSPFHRRRALNCIAHLPQPPMSETTVSVDRGCPDISAQHSTISGTASSMYSVASGLGQCGGSVSPSPSYVAPPFAVDASIELEYTLIQPIDEAELLEAGFRGWTMPTLVPDNEHVPRSIVDEYALVHLPPIMTEAWADRLTHDLPTSGRRDTFIPVRALRKHPFPDHVNVPPPLRHSPLHRLAFSISRSGSQGCISSKRPAVSTRNGNPSSRPSPQPSDSSEGLISGYSFVSPYPRLYQSSTRVELAYIAHPPTKSTYLVLVNTHYRVSTPFYAHCGDRIGDFVIKSFERGYRGFFAYSIERRDPHGVSTAFYDPRILLVPRALVQREHNITEFAEEEARIIREEWIMFPEGRYTARLDAALELGEPCVKYSTPIKLANRQYAVHCMDSGVAVVRLRNERGMWNVVNKVDGVLDAPPPLTRFQSFSISKREFLRWRKDHRLQVSHAASADISSRRIFGIPYPSRSPSSYFFAPTTSPIREQQAYQKAPTALHIGPYTSSLVHDKNGTVSIGERNSLRPTLQVGASHSMLSPDGVVFCIDDSSRTNTHIRFIKRLFTGYHLATALQEFFRPTIRVDVALFAHFPTRTYFPIVVRTSHPISAVCARCRDRVGTFQLHFTGSSLADCWVFVMLRRHPNRQIHPQIILVPIPLLDPCIEDYFSYGPAICDIAASGQV